MATGQDLGQALRDVAARFSGRLGLAATNLATGERVEIDADTSYPTASVIKLPVLVELYRQAAEGRIDLDRRVELRAEERVGGSGILKELASGLRPTVRDLAVLMVVLSDNTATNMVIDLVGGVEPVNRTMQERLGLRSIVLHNRVDFDRIGGDVRRFAESTPRDMAALVERIGRGEVVDPATSAAIVDILRRQQYLDQVPRYLAVNPYAKELGLAEELWVGCKTGFFTGTRVDAGLIRLPGDRLIAYCAMNDEGADRTFAPEAEGAVVNGAIGRLLVEHWWPGAGAAGALLEPASGRGLLGG